MWIAKVGAVINTLLIYCICLLVLRQGTYRSVSSQLMPLVRRLEVNLDVEIKTQHRGSIAWLDVDRAEERYLLTGEFPLQVLATGRVQLFPLR